MSRNIGFVFLFSQQPILKPYSEENKKNYQNKILLHNVSLLSHLGESKVKSSLINTINDKASISKIIQREFGIKASYIIDYNPIPKKLLKTIDKNLIVYAVILDYKKKHKIINLLQESTKTTIFVDSMLFMYNLKSINSDSPDIFSSIKNYSTISRKVNLYNKQTTDILSIPFNYIIECLCGIEELRVETKNYI